MSEWAAGKKKTRGHIKGEYKVINSKKYIGKFPVIFRSSWELRLMKFFDRNENVLQWASESLAVPYYDPITKRMRRYFPDFVVIYKNNNGDIVKEIIEVKPRKQVKEPVKKTNQKMQSYIKQMETYVTNYRKWESAKHVARKMGYKFRIITEADLF